MARTSVLLTYLLLLVPPLAVSTFYVLVSFPTPPRRLPVAVFPGLASLPPESRAREIYAEDWISNGKYAEFPMGRTRYWLAGPESGTKVVLIHGLSVPALVWAHLVPQLAAAGHHVLLYDLYGRGYSDAPAAAAAAYDPQLYLTQLALLMQHVGWARARLVGISMGGAVAAAFVAAFPQLVADDVVLIACAGLLQSADLPRTAKVMSSPIVQLITANPLVKAYLRHLAARADPSTHPDDATALAELVRLQSAHLPGFNRAVSSSLRNGPVTGMQWAFESAEWVDRRVLIVHGTQDQTVPPTHAARIRALLLDATSPPPDNTTASTSTPTTSISTPASPTGWGYRSWFAAAASSDSPPPSAFKHEQQQERVRVEMIPGAGHALTWTHAAQVGGLVCAFLEGGPH